VFFLSNLRIAVVGSGISGLSCAWALSQRHNVTLIESDSRLGGHAHTVTVPTERGHAAIDTGFIVFNKWTYPNFTAMMAYLDQAVTHTEMSFSVSAQQGRYEYNSDTYPSLFGTWRQWCSPKHLRMLADIYRFYTQAEKALARTPENMTLGRYLTENGYGEAFMQRHILPMAGAIWSATPEQIAGYPLHAFIRFFANHKLFEVGTRPIWSTVKGGSRAYVEKLIEDSKFSVLLNAPVRKVHRAPAGVEVEFAGGGREAFDQIVLATHGDTALKLLAQPSTSERHLLSAFKTSANRVYLHRDESLMPKARRFWSAWNYRVPLEEHTLSPEVTYWMNKLQNLETPQQHFVSLNPKVLPKPDSVDGVYNYRHPIFNAATLEAQKDLWSLQGADRIWFCGAWFGSGFHEDGLQAGLAVAEQLGGLRRPWNVKDESGRINLIPRHSSWPSHHVEAAE
jgi:uncharacterized protein